MKTILLIAMMFVTACLEDRVSMLPTAVEAGDASPADSATQTLPDAVTAADAGPMDAATSDETGASADALKDAPDIQDMQPDIVPEIAQQLDSSADTAPDAPVDVQSDVTAIAAACVPANCDDGNPCTQDSCDKLAGCTHMPGSGASCAASSAACPVGTCTSGVCTSTPGVPCEVTYSADLCSDVKVSGLCSAGGTCTVDTAPTGYTCPGCMGICEKCFIYQVCIPF